MKGQSKQGIQGRSCESYVCSCVWLEVVSEQQEHGQLERLSEQEHHTVSPCKSTREYFQAALKTTKQLRISATGESEKERKGQMKIVHFLEMHCSSI